ncbi:MAG: hypothetical protein ACI4IK_02945 [Eubacterium sp.]
MDYLVTKNGVSYIVKKAKTTEFKANGYTVTKIVEEKPKPRKKAKK